MIHARLQGGMRDITTSREAPTFHAPRNAPHKTSEPKGSTGQRAVRAPALANRERPQRDQRPRHSACHRQLQQAQRCTAKIAVASARTRRVVSLGKSILTPKN